MKNSPSLTYGPLSLVRKAVPESMRKYNRIKAALADKGKTAKWLASEVGRDRSTISRWCTNDIQPPVEVLFQIAELLEVDVCELLIRTIPKKK